jgi:hypothetical protein
MGNSLGLNSRKNHMVAIRNDNGTGAPSLCGINQTLLFPNPMFNKAVSILTSRVFCRYSRIVICYWLFGIRFSVRAFGIEIMRLTCAVLPIRNAAMGT